MVSLHLLGNIKGPKGDKGDTGAAVGGIVTTKGDLVVGTGDGAATRLPVGANGRQVFADSSTASGLRWSSRQGELPAAGDVFSADNLNAVVTPGTYVVNGSAANNPAAASGFVVVLANGVNLMQEFTTNSTAPRKYIRRSADTGATWSAWTEVRTGAAWAGNTLTGAGSPLGVVSAPVGTRYVDTDVTTGASEWIKVSGTATSGWQVTSGDTGWREVGAVVTWDDTRVDPAKSRGVLVRRVNNIVEVNAQWSLPTGFVTTFGQAFTGSVLSNGWKPKATTPMTFRCGSGNVPTTSIVEFDANGRISVLYHASWTTGAPYRMQTTFTTIDPWPTTLPGVAA